MTRIWLVILTLSWAGVAVAGSDDNRLQERYRASCKLCHATGAMGAPRAKRSEQWKKPLAKGMPVLLDHVKNGYGGMPPKGYCGDCSDEEFRALIEFMAN